MSKRISPQWSTSLDQPLMAKIGKRRALCPIRDRMKATRHINIESLSAWTMESIACQFNSRRLTLMVCFLYQELLPEDATKSAET